MLACPKLKVEASPNYDPLEPFKGWPSGQGLVSWGTCLKCSFNKGCNRKKLTIKCDFDPNNVITLESWPL